MPEGVNKSDASYEDYLDQVNSIKAHYAIACMMIEPLIGKLESASIEQISQYEKDNILKNCNSLKADLEKQYNKIIEMATRMSAAMRAGGKNLEKRIEVAMNVIQPFGQFMEKRMVRVYRMHNYFERVCHCSQVTQEQVDQSNPTKHQSVLEQKIQQVSERLEDDEWMYMCFDPREDECVLFGIEASLEFYQSELQRLEREKLNLAGSPHRLQAPKDNELGGGVKADDKSQLKP